MPMRVRSFQPEFPGIVPLPESCYAEEGVVLYRGDCLDILPLLPQESVAMITPPRPKETP